MTIETIPPTPFVRPRSVRGALVLLSFLLLSSFARPGGGTQTFLTRGPFFQEATANGITLVCRTNVTAAVTLRYGESVGPPWEGELTSTPGTTHVFDVGGLRPETRYVYELSEGERILASGKDFAFRTSPPAQSRAPFHFLAWGDSGTGTLPQFDVAARILAVEPEPALTLMLGDIVYEDGQREGYDPKFFTPYAPLLRRTHLWTTIGNHDAHTEDGAPYFENFFLPTDTGAPGHPSGKENYYSFDHGMAHFVCLDAQLSDSTPGGVMSTWLTDDLADARARGKRWLIVFLHKPPYSRGSHDSTAEPDLIKLHDDLVPLFDANHVDLVLSGHSHSYERSFLLQGDAVLQPDLTDYSKLKSGDGTVYVVTGCAGNNGSGPLDLPIMAVSLSNVFGFSQFDVNWSSLRGRFIERDGRTTDLFTLHKSVENAPPRVAVVEPSTPDRLTLVFDEPVLDGAANPALYSLDPPGAVLGAELLSDRSTVVLETTPLEPNRVHTLDLAGVADMHGTLVTEHVLFSRREDGGSPTSVVPRGATWRFHDGRVALPPDWMAPGFDDRSWSQGPAGFGYADEDDATELLDMQGHYSTLYLRNSFQIDDPARVHSLVLDVDYDDGFVAFLNGAEITRANVSAPQDNSTLASSGHEAREFESFDVTSLRSLLVAGRNVLAVEGHNASLGGDDFTLHPELVTTVDGVGGPPHARMDVEVRTANVPALVHFSAEESSDADGPLEELRWDFGDGSPDASGIDVDHLYESTGTFVVTLVARDSDALESIAQTTIRVHDQGLAPSAILGVTSKQIQPGASVNLDSSGSVDPDGGPLSIHWDFVDPVTGLADSSENAPVLEFPAVGTYPVTLVVTDDEGSIATDETTITVATGEAPAAQFSSRPERGAPLHLVFTDLSTGDVSSWLWEFGDGATSPARSPVHGYAAPGDYTVRLTVGGPSGSDSIEAVVNVRPVSSSGGGGGCTMDPHAGSGRSDPLLAAAAALGLLALLRQSRRRYVLENS